HHLFIERQDDHLRARRLPRVRLFDPPRDEIQLRPGALDRHAGFEPPDHSDDRPTPRISAFIQRQWYPHVGLGLKLKTRRHHADDLPSLATQCQYPARDVRVGAEPPRPEAVAQDDDGDAWTILFRR